MGKHLHLCQSIWFIGVKKVTWELKPVYAEAWQELSKPIEKAEMSGLAPVIGRFLTRRRSLETLKGRG